MIPEFPQFKKLELSDKEDIEKYTSQFPPYSDFNFVSIWSWDTEGKTRISQFNNNLIIRFIDYLTNKPFYSFLGEEKENETIEELLKFLEKEDSTQILKLIPEEVGHNLLKSNFNLTPDRDSSDYIYSVSYLSNMHNWTKHNLCKNIKNFLKLHPNHIVKHCLLTEAPKNECIEVFKKWAKNKKTKKNSELNEYKALKRIFELNYDNIYAVLIYIENSLVGFTIYEVLSPYYAISHFAKSDTEYHYAISTMLNWEESKELNKKGVKYVNWEQDLGILGLRQSKEKHKPSFLFKKLIISHRS